jgi:hypothetical protein
VLAARAFFRTGRAYIARVESLRCRLAATLYTDNFEGVLETIEQDGYRLRAEYPPAQGASATLKIMEAFLKSAFMQHHNGLASPGTHPEARQL